MSAARPADEMEQWDIQIGFDPDTEAGVVDVKYRSMPDFTYLYAEEARELGWRLIEAAHRAKATHLAGESS